MNNYKPMCVDNDCGVHMIMNSWLLSFGFDATNYNQDHVNAFRRILCYQLHLNRPKVSNKEDVKVKVVDDEVILLEAGAVRKGTKPFNDVKIFDNDNKCNKIGCNNVTSNINNQCIDMTEHDESVEH